MDTQRLQRAVRGLLAALVLGGCHASVPALGAASPTGDPVLRIVDGDTLVLGADKHRLFGMDAPEAQAVCVDSASRFWRCGERATERLIELTRHAAVTCIEVPGERDGYGRKISRCRAAGIDLADRLVREGLAWAYVKYSQEHVAAEAEARRAGRGVWQAPNEPAWEARARARAARVPAERPPTDGCRIKGNVSGSGRIYHLPGSRDYAATRISPGRGERWFCSEADAVAAGWRARR